jgi:hypothetical protein
MKINLVYIGTDNLLHLRRDMLEFYRYNFEDVGCDVTFTYNNLVSDRVNILFGTTELAEENMLALSQNDKARYVVFDTEIITGKTINNRDDFPMETYIKFLSAAELVLAGFPENVAFWQDKGLKCMLIELRYASRLEEIRHKQDKDIDVFFFGLVTEYRRDILNNLAKAGLNVQAHGYAASPYFLRNSHIERAKLVANISQGPQYDHVNGLRGLYLAINACCTVAEIPSKITQGFDALQYTSESPEKFIDDCVSIIKEERYRDMGREFQQIAKQQFSDMQSTADIVAALASA